MKHIDCKYCGKTTNTQNIAKHERHCYLNPENLLECKCCGKPIKNYRYSKGTCSRSCANTYFRSGEDNGNFRGNNYQTICFYHHKKECVVCGEDKIVAVHHNDHNHHNNDPQNLIPMCPTHHQYVHSRWRNEVQPIIDKYIQEWEASKLPVA